MPDGDKIRNEILKLLESSKRIVLPFYWFNFLLLNSKNIFSCQPPSIQDMYHVHKKMQCVQELPETEPLWYMSQIKEHRRLLNHPVITSFLWMKWRRIRKNKLFKNLRTKKFKIYCHFQDFPLNQVVSAKLYTSFVLCLCQLFIQILYISGIEYD